MPYINQTSMAVIERLFQMESGYVLDFSNNSMARFFTNELNIDIYHDTYSEDGTSKARRLRCFLRKASIYDAVRVLKALWQYRETMRQLHGQNDSVPNAQVLFLNLVNQIEGRPVAATQSPQTTIVQPDYARLAADLIALNQLAPQQRGYAFEDFLKRLFDVHGLEAREGFRNRGEQIDGSFQLNGVTYLLEAKWQNAQTQASDLHTFQGKINQRPNWTRGLFISYSGFTEDGLYAFGRGNSIICADGLDLHEGLSRQILFNRVLEGKVRRATETGDVMVRVRDLFPG